MRREEPSPDPSDLVRRFRQSYTNYYTLWTVTDSTPKGVTLRTPQQQPLDETQLPEALRDRLAAYRRAHPEERMTLLKYMRTVNGDPQTVIEDERDLPAEDELLTMSQTVTLNTIDHLDVITDLFVARRE
jgi:hypothetical protein